jgi:hypothetical protein
VGPPEAPLQAAAAEPLEAAAAEPLEAAAAEPLEAAAAEPLEAAAAAPPQTADAVSPSATAAPPPPPSDRGVSLRPARLRGREHVRLLFSNEDGPLMRTCVEVRRPGKLRLMAHGVAQSAGFRSPVVQN